MIVMMKTFTGFRVSVNNKENIKKYLNNGTGLKLWLK
jgi:hypothetical protein